jgi:uncharacterized protein YdiU (UPF0061 family)
VREIIASEALHRLGVTTSRTLTLVESGEDLWRGDEPSPTRSSVMVRMARTHLRFGTCERLLHLGQPVQLERLLRHVVAVYYPHLAVAHPADGTAGAEPLLLAFYGELVERVARLAAEWMVAGFTHGVLNTDNMSLAGESFDYGPFAFLETWDPDFTAAYFDHSGLYAYGRQPLIAHHNLRLLQEPLAMLLPRAQLEVRLERFVPTYDAHYLAGLLRRLGFDSDARESAGENATDLPDLVPLTLQLLAAWPASYGGFFTALADRLERRDLPAEAEALAPFVAGAPEPPRQQWLAWRDAWWFQQQVLPPESQARVAATARRWNLSETPVRPVIERLWEAIDQQDDWGPLYDWLTQVGST